MTSLSSNNISEKYPANICNNSINFTEAIYSIYNRALKTNHMLYNYKNHFSGGLNQL